MKNYEVFERFLEAEDFYMEKRRDDNCVFYRTEQRTENGATVLIVCAFYDDSNIIDVEIYNLAKVSSPLKEEKFLYLINELNSTSRFTKFILTPNNDIKLFYSYIDNNFTMDSANHLWNVMLMLFRSAEEAYPKFMKLQWA